MEKYITFVLLGVILLVLGFRNYKGDISSIHWYNRRKVSDNDVPLYGKYMGMGTMICGGTLLVTMLLEVLLHNPVVELLIPVGFIIGVMFMLYAQFKFNRGLF